MHLTSTFILKPQMTHEWHKPSFEFGSLLIRMRNVFVHHNVIQMSEYSNHLLEALPTSVQILHHAAQRECVCNVLTFPAAPAAAPLDGVALLAHEHQSARVTVPQRRRERRRRHQRPPRRLFRRRRRQRRVRVQHRRRRRRRRS